MVFGGSLKCNIAYNAEYWLGQYRMHVFGQKEVRGNGEGCCYGHEYEIGNDKGAGMNVAVPGLKMLRVGMKGSLSKFFVRDGVFAGVGRRS